MRTRSLWRGALALLPLCVAASGPALADKPSWAGSGKHGKQHVEERAHDSRDGGMAVDIVIGHRDRQIIVDYYQSQARAGHCPPGLAKKRNGCLPPGQAKKWAVGRPLPADVVYHDLPRDLVVRLPVPAAGHRYVQVAADILLIAVGSGMVVDAVQDLMR